MDHRHFELEPRTLCFYRRRDLGYFLFDVKIRVGLDIAHAVASAEVKLARCKTVFLLHHRNKAEHYDRRALENVLREHLRANMTVKARKVYIRHFHCPERKLLGLPRFYGDAEFGIDLARGHRLVGVRVYARSKAQQDALGHSAPRSLGLYSLKLLRVIRNKAAHALIHRVSNVLIGLVISVEKRILHGVARRKCREDLAAGDDVNAHVLLAHYLVNALKGICLARIQCLCLAAEMLSERLRIDAAVVSEPVLVDEIQRCAVIIRKHGGILPRKIKMSVFTDAYIIAYHAFSLGNL